MRAGLSTAPLKLKVNNIPKCVYTRHCSLLANSVEGEAALTSEIKQKCPNRLLTFSSWVHERLHVHELCTLFILEHILPTGGKFFVPRGPSVCFTSWTPFLRRQSHRPIKCIPRRFPLRPEPCPANQRRASIFQRIGWVFTCGLFFRVQLRYSKKSTRELCLTACGQAPIKQPPVSAALVCECGPSERMRLSEQQWRFGKLSHRPNAPLCFITSKTSSGHNKSESSNACGGGK